MAIDPAIGNTNIDDLRGSDLLKDLWYVNLHTTTFSPGEIRGQVTAVPEPSTFALLGFGLLLAAGTRRRLSR